MAIARLLAGSSLCLALAALPAHAGWREELGVFRIGIVSGEGERGSIRGSDEIRGGFSAALGMQVEIFAAKDYAVLVDAQASGRIHYAIHTATSYAATSLLCGCVEPVVAPLAEDGSFGIRSVLLAGPDGPATAEAAVAGRVAFGPPDSVTGALLPRAEFRPGGVELSGAEPYLVAVTSAEDAERRLIAGDVDAMFGFVLSTDDPASASGGSPQRLRDAGLDGAISLWVSPLLRNGPHAAGSNLPEEARRLLGDYMVGLREADPALYDLMERRFTGGFARVSAEDYTSALSLVRKTAAASAGQ